MRWIVLLAVGCAGTKTIELPPPELIDAPPASPLCGNGALDPGEACDGNGRACGELGASFAGGTAACRADCGGWDPRACTLANAGRYEAVKPAERDPRWQTARCNDGSPFAFVVRMASPPSDDWIIYLEGGVYCDDYSFACAQRDRYLTSTLPFADRALGPIPFTGLFGAGFARANQVLAHYCSSDFWAGARTDLRPSTGGSWYFSGHAHVDALFGILAERYGLDDTRAGLAVLFGGGSAGAFGAHFNASRVVAALPATAVAGRLQLLVDAGWMTDWNDPAHRLGSATTPDRDVWRRARAFWGATFDPACEAASADPVDCWFGPGWYPHVAAALPTLVQQSSIDQSFMQVHGMQAGGPGTQPWFDQVSASLAPVSWLFSGARSYHMLGIDDATLQLGPSGRTFAQTLAGFRQHAPAQRVVF